MNKLIVLSFFSVVAFAQNTSINGVPGYSLGSQLTAGGTIAANTLVAQSGSTWVVAPVGAASCAPATVATSAATSGNSFSVSNIPGTITQLYADTAIASGSRFVGCPATTAGYVPDLGPATQANLATIPSTTYIVGIATGPVSAGALASVQLNGQWGGSVGPQNQATIGSNSTGNLVNGGVNMALLFPHWRKALANVRAGTGNARILCVGDSTTSGYGGSTQSTMPTLKSFPQRLAQMLNSTVTPTAVGLGVPPSMLSGNPDTRWAGGSGWSSTSNAFGAGGGATWSGTGTTGNLVYSSAINSDSYYVYYVGNSGLGTLAFTATGGSTVTVNTGSLSLYTYRTLVTAGSASSSNTVTITGSGGSVYVLGVEPLLSTTFQVLVGNAGVGSSTTTTWTNNSTTFGGAALIKVNAPDLTIISLGINDAGNSVTAATVTANIQTLINAAQVSGDVILCLWPPSSGSPYTTYEPLYYPAIYALAKTDNLYVFDEYARLGSAWNSNFMSGTLHPNDQGYFDWAQGLYQTLNTF